MRSGLGINVYELKIYVDKLTEKKTMMIIIIIKCLKAKVCTPPRSRLYTYLYAYANLSCADVRECCKIFQLCVVFIIFLPRVTGICTWAQSELQNNNFYTLSWRYDQIYSWILMNIYAYKCIIRVYTGTQNWCTRIW